VSIPTELIEGTYGEPSLSLLVVVMVVVVVIVGGVVGIVGGLGVARGVESSG